MSFKRLGAPLVVVAGVLIALTAVMGFLHTPAGVHVYQRLTGQSCPFAGGMTPKKRDAARAVQAKKLMGYQAAREKIALGFTFDKTTRQNIEQWARDTQAHCATARTSGELECAASGLRNIPSQDSADGTLFFDFDARSRLKRVTAMVNLRDASKATQALDKVADAISQRAGGDVLFDGENDPIYLQGMLRQVRTQFHYSDFFAKAQVTHIGHSYVLEQHYETLTF